MSDEHVTGVLGTSHPGLLQYGSEHLRQVCNLQPILLLENKRKEQVVAHVFWENKVTSGSLLQTDVKESEVVNNAFCATLA